MLNMTRLLSNIFVLILRSLPFTVLKIWSKKLSNLFLNFDRLIMLMLTFLIDALLIYWCIGWSGF